MMQSPSDKKSGWSSSKNWPRLSRELHFMPGLFLSNPHLPPVTDIGPASCLKGHPACFYSLLFLPLHWLSSIHLFLGSKMTANLKRYLLSYKKHEV